MDHLRASFTSSPEHLLFNMITLWAFGPSVELILKSQALYRILLTQRIRGHRRLPVAVAIAIFRCNTRHQLSSAVQRASSGVLVAAANMSPKSNHPADLAPGPITFLKLLHGYINWLCCAGNKLPAAITPVEEAAHLGGALVGYILIRNIHWFFCSRPSAEAAKILEAGRSEFKFFPAGSVIAETPSPTFKH